MGVRKKIRKCDQPRPSNGGKDCIGKYSLIEYCEVQNCPGKINSTSFIAKKVCVFVALK